MGWVRGVPSGWRLCVDDCEVFDVFIGHVAVIRGRLDCRSAVYGLAEFASADRGLARLPRSLCKGIYVGACVYRSLGGGHVVDFPGTGVGLKLGIIDGHPSNCRGVRAVFCPVPIGSTLRVIETSAFSFARAKVPMSIPVRGGLIIGTLGLLGSQCGVPRLRIRLLGTVPFKTKLNKNSTSTTFVLGLLGSCYKLRVLRSDLRRLTSSVKTSYPFFVHGAPMFTSNAKGVFRAIRLSLTSCRLYLIGPSITISAPRTCSVIAPTTPTVSLGRVVQEPIKR